MFVQVAEELATRGTSLSMSTECKQSHKNLKRGQIIDHLYTGYNVRTTTKGIAIKRHDINLSI